MAFYLIKLRKDEEKCKKIETKPNVEHGDNNTTVDLENKQTSENVDEIVEEE